jgi:hypothetical protein
MTIHQQYRSALFDLQSKDRKQNIGHKQTGQHVHAKVVTSYTTARTQTISSKSK